MNNNKNKNKINANNNPITKLRFGMLAMSVMTILSVFVLFTGFATPVFAATEFPQDLEGFNASAGDPPISIDFDNIAANTDITGSEIVGVTLEGPGSNLIVVVGDDTFTPPEFSGIIDAATNKLFSTTGDNVLSPGGLELGAGFDPVVEEDDLILIFDPPVSSFGLDILYQSFDCCLFTTIKVFDSSDVQIFSATPSGAGGGGQPGDYAFWGIVAEGSEDIKKIVIDESDGNNINPDSNIGFDTFRFFATEPEELFCEEPESYYNIINGTESQDYLLGTNSPDLIFGNGGNDMIYSIGENNCIYAGDGNDFVLAHKDGNTVYGGAGDDSIMVKGTGIVYGEDGDDSIYIIKHSAGHLIDGGEGSDLCVANGKRLINAVNCEIIVPQ